MRRVIYNLNFFFIFKKQKFFSNDCVSAYLDQSRKINKTQDNRTSNSAEYNNFNITFESKPKLVIWFQFTIYYIGYTGYIAFSYSNLQYYFL